MSVTGSSDQVRAVRAWASLAGLALLVAACATTGEGTEQSDPLPGEASIGLGRGEALPTFTPGETAAINWQRAEAAFGEGSHLLAQRYYIYIRRKFPYSKFAVLSDVRIADCQYERERYLEAIDGYQNFVRLHPTHPKVPYAMYRAAMGYKEQIPQDWFFLPPAHEKDQSAVRDTAKALTGFLKRYPKDDNAAEAQALLDDVRSRLMAHERYVADFYQREGKIRGYVGRLERIRREYADVGLDPELLLEIIEAYVRLEDRSKAKRTLEELGEKFPGSPELANGTASLAKLEARLDAPQPPDEGTTPELTSPAEDGPEEDEDA